MSDMVPEQYKSRVYAEVMKTATPSALTKAIREKRTELSNLKLQTTYVRAKKAALKAAKAIHKQVGESYEGITSGLYKLGKVRLKNKQVMKGKQKVTIVENQPVYSRDKSRFFKTAWEEEKRQLFFK
jgi:glycerate-2-kinase